ncbi:MAG TPA: M14 family metallopeptidase [Lacipirellulaceae bacterium]|nr:M14 family metallopeptidase [Lacipirellulaceae bacterium]
MPTLRLVGDMVLNVANANVGSHIAELKEELFEATSYYSTDYFSARQRFLAASAQLGIEHHSLHIQAPSPNSEPLSIDIAVVGAAKPRSALVLSSGVHGVEGLFGSAIQLAFLEKIVPNWRPPVEAAVILIHAINPFGFAWQRRFNEDNVDLNRNFLLAEEQYAGSPPLSDKFRRAMKPRRPRMRFGFWTARMALLALRHGIHSFWETLPVGQYDYPDWLFFGGQGPTQSVQTLERFLPTLLDEAQKVAHLDFHTGLGRWADCQLLVSESEGIDSCEWWLEHFGANMVKRLKSYTRAYEVRGGFGPWLRALFPDCAYRYSTAEFGTYSPMRVIGALADELRWHGRLGVERPAHPSRRRLANTFVPRSRSWRTKTLHTGLSLVERAADVLWHSNGSGDVAAARQEARSI